MRGFHFTVQRPSEILPAIRPPVHAGGFCTVTESGDQPACRARQALAKGGKLGQLFGPLNGIKMNNHDARYITPRRWRDRTPRRWRDRFVVRRLAFAAVAMAVVAAIVFVVFHYHS